MLKLLLIFSIFLNFLPTRALANSRSNNNRRKVARVVVIGITFAVLA